MELDEGQPLLLVPGEGEVVGDTPERRVEILCDREELVVTWTRFGPYRDGASPHVHRTHSDLFYVLGGELTLFVGPEAEPRVLAPGTLAFAPPLVVHGFRNAADAELRYLNLHAPGARFADFLRGRLPDFDQHEPPADGGRPVDDAVIVPPGTGGVLLDRDEIFVELRDEQLEIRAPGRGARALHVHMRLLATLMASITLLTTGLFAHALATAGADTPGIASSR